MSDMPTPNQPQVPPDVLHYLNGPTAESLQFQFLIGEWTTEGTRHSPGGEPANLFSGGWHAQYLHDRRMVMDDFTVFSPSGQEISSFITLRTYSPITQQWEMAGLGAFQPATIRHWNGRQVAGEMHLEAEGVSPDGRLVKMKIRFHEISDNSFKWESQASVDNGVSWIKASTLIAKRVR